MRKIYKLYIGIILSVIAVALSLIHISEPTRQAEISYAVFCLKKKTKDTIYTRTARNS